MAIQATTHTRGRISAPAQIRQEKREWPQKGTKSTKEKLLLISDYVPFVPFCGCY
jgi:hypothetical protein